MSIRVFLCALLIGVAGAATAQTQPAPAQRQAATKPLTAQQRAAVQKQNQELVTYANSIVAMIDNGQAGQVWEGASEVAKKATSKKQFVQTTDGELAKLGKVDSRKVANVTRTMSRGSKALPAGEYINVNYATKFSKEAKPILEKVSFHLDNDKKWRVSGYKLYASRQSGGP